MDGNNWRPQGGETTTETGDWRAKLQPDSRQRIVNKIMETLKRHLPVSGNEGLNDLKKIAQMFEEKIYTTATSQSDYLRRISMKMLVMESKAQNTAANSVANSSQPPDPDTANHFGTENLDSLESQGVGRSEETTCAPHMPSLNSQVGPHESPETEWPLISLENINNQTLHDEGVGNNR